MPAGEDFVAWIKEQKAAYARRHGPISTKALAALDKFEHERTLGADRAELDVAARLKESAEYKFYCGFFPERSTHRESALMGLRLREAQHNLAEAEALLSEFKGAPEPRRRAQAFQCGAIQAMFQDLRQRGAPPREQADLVMQFLDDIDDHALFVTELGNHAAAAAAILEMAQRLRGHPCGYLLLGGSGTAARTAREAGKLLELRLQNYQEVWVQGTPNAYAALFARLG